MSILDELSDDDPLGRAVLDARRAAHGDSNDSEIELLQAALELALDRAGVFVRDLTDDEIEAL